VEAGVGGAKGAQSMERAQGNLTDFQEMFSILSVSFIVWSGALDSSPHVILPYLIKSLASPMTIILICTS